MGWKRLTFARQSERGGGLLSVERFSSPVLGSKLPKSLEVKRPCSRRPPKTRTGSSVRCQPYRGRRRAGCLGLRSRRLHGGGGEGLGHRLLQGDGLRRPRGSRGAQEEEEREE